jgi:Tol biopolymer transport system component/imidazolonepropionase-like amidohydrolase
MFFRPSFIVLWTFFLAWTCIAPQTRASGPQETISIRVSEGTNLAFDVSPDGRTIVFDLLGQLWLVPAAGGKARPITNAVRDVAEDLDPTFSPDGRNILFRGERNGRTGLWLLEIGTGAIRQLTQLSNPDGFDGNATWSPDGKSIAFVHAVPPDGVGSRWRMAAMIFDVVAGNTSEISFTGIKDPPVLQALAWMPGGKAVAFVVRGAPGESGGRVWSVSADGGEATPLTEESLRVIAPEFSHDGRRMAYFSPDNEGRMQVWVRAVQGGAPTQLTTNKDVTTTHVRWIRGDSALMYSADGRLWTVAASGGQPVEIKFTAGLSITRQRRSLPPAQLLQPGRLTSARGFTGLSISPDGKQIGMLALGKLWVIPVGGAPRSIADVPFDASALAWSPDGSEVAWSAGVSDHEDIFATNLSTGTTRKVTALPGRETFPTYSPDGRYLAFVHIKDDGVLRLVDAKSADINDPAQTKDLGSIGLNWTCTPQWSPDSVGLLACGGTNPNELGHATFLPVSGNRETIVRFANAPIFVQWTPQNKIVYVRHDRLWEAKFDRTGTLSAPQPIGSDPALYASSSREGTILFYSADGLRIRAPDGKERNIGWPVKYTPPVAEATLIKNVRIIDGTGAPATTPRDILIEQGRIARITSAGGIPAGIARVIDAAGRIVIPGLMDLHAHIYRPDLLPGFSYFGVTTIRDQGSSMAPLVSYADNIASGVLPGPRVSYGGFQFYSDWPFDEEQGRGIEPEADPDHIRRSVALLAAFGAQHIKTRTFRRWDINARMINEAHRLGLRATGHCSHLLPLIAAGMDAKEHIGVCEERGNTHMYDDMLQLFRAAGIAVVPTISYFQFAVRLSGEPNSLDADTELAPFMPARENFGWMLNLKEPARRHWVDEYENAKIETGKLFRAGVALGTGTDIWQVPIGVHWELEQMVEAGLTPLQAIRAATGNAARIIGAENELGTIETGKWADLVILDADPVNDIRNTRRIWNVMQYGRLVDRAGILKVIKPR